MGCEQTWCECMELAALALLVRFLSDISFPGCVVSKCPHALPHRNTDWCSLTQTPPPQFLTGYSLLRLAERRK